MLGDASEFTPLDLLGALAVNAVTTKATCEQDVFRLGIANKSGEIPPWADFRFLGGIAAAAVAQFGGPMVRRAGNDAALGLLGSFVATETCRNQAIKKLNEAGGSSAAAAGPPQAEPQAAPAGAQNHQYGW